MKRMALAGLGLLALGLLSHAATAFQLDGLEDGEGRLGYQDVEGRLRKEDEVERLGNEDGEERFGNEDKEASLGNEDEEGRLGYEDGEGRLGYISIGSNGATSLTFNATSIQVGAVALILPHLELFHNRWFAIRVTHVWLSVQATKHRVPTLMRHKQGFDSHIHIIFGLL
jgi:hypothetical protein